MAVDSTEYREFLEQAGFPQDQREDLLAQYEAVEAALDARRCPACGRGLQRGKDPRQVGPRPPGTSWYNYECPPSQGGCGFRADRAESD